MPREYRNNVGCGDIIIALIIGIVLVIAVAKGIISACSNYRPKSTERINKEIQWSQDKKRRDKEQKEREILLKNNKCLNCKGRGFIIRVTNQYKAGPKCDRCNETCEHEHITCPVCSGTGISQKE